MIRIQDWGCLLSSILAALALIAGLAGHYAIALAFAAGVIAAAAVARAGYRRHPGPLPPSLRWVLFLPRGPHSPRRLLRSLAPRPGEKILEVGPGAGIHTPSVARALLPEGELEAVDIQRAMLEATARRADAAALRNVTLCLCDVARLPHPDDTFDGAFMITVLGETTNPEAVMLEILRVLKPAGRLIVGEMIVDADFLPLGEVRRLARRTGFAIDTISGSRLAFLARLTPRVAETSPCGAREH